MKLDGSSVRHALASCNSASSGFRPRRLLGTNTHAENLQTEKENVKQFEVANSVLKVKPPK
eukprot:6464367-Amphidinium_carterae.1